MRLFGPVYARVLAWAGHPRARWYLGGLSFAESTFFPVPPDLMLIPMVLARPDRGLHLALLCTVTSVVGGVFGYLIGFFAFDLIEPWLRTTHYFDAYLEARAYFAAYGFWVILIAGFSPIPYKVFTITAGVLAMPVLPFVLGSIVGRGGRFFLVSGLIVLGGERMEQRIRRHVEWLGWGLVAAVVAVLAWVRFA